MCRALLNFFLNCLLPSQCHSRADGNPFRLSLKITLKDYFQWVPTYAEMTRKRRQTVAIFLLLASGIAYALPEDREQPFNIIADSSIFNYKTGIDTYEGNVKVDQGTCHLTADRLVTQKNKQHKMIIAIATGIKKLAEYTTVPKVGDPTLNAKARIIKFYPPTSIVILEQDVFITQKENSFHGPLIIYNMKDQVVTAPASKNGRATIVIEPEQLKS